MKAELESILFKYFFPYCRIKAVEYEYSMFRWL